MKPRFWRFVAVFVPVTVCAAFVVLGALAEEAGNKLLNWAERQ